MPSLSLDNNVASDDHSLSALPLSSLPEYPL